ncbi:hypothetical protein J31TS4_19010 [Paenibacillus sp. J31TS4]|nr:hypothetical protein J31TS4_19010 [Paenibacillus sp. J31TS4]
MSKKPKRPTRDEFVLEELGERLVEAMREKERVVLDVWAEEKTPPCTVVELDARTSRVGVMVNGTKQWIPFLDIMSVEYPRD